MVNEKTNNTGAAEKRKSATAQAFGKLSRREQTMIFALLAVGVVCALYFFVVQPGLDRLSTLDAEATKAEETQDEYSAAIAAGPVAAKQSAAAMAAYDEAKTKIFSPMSIETLDSTVTGYLESAGFNPETLSMSQLQAEELTPFSPQPLSESPVPENVDMTPVPEEAVGETAADDATVDDAAADEATVDEAAANETAADETAADEAPAALDNPDDQLGDVGQSGGSVYSYSASISAHGGWDNLYNLLGILADTSGVELTQYSYSAGGGDDAATGSFSMTIKFYVFIEGAVAGSGEAPSV
jgi:hypothetical protein